MGEIETLEGWEGPDPASSSIGSPPPMPDGVETTESQGLMLPSLLGRSVESLSYLIAFIGIVGDHISTRIGLLFPNILETNSFTLLLRQNRLWLLFDALLLAMSIGLPTLLMRKWGFKGRWAVLAFPALIGVARLFAALHNLFMIAISF